MNSANTVLYEIGGNISKFPVGRGSEPRPLELSDVEGFLGSSGEDWCPPPVEPFAQVSVSHETKWNAAVRLGVSVWPHLRIPSWSFE